MFHLTRNPDIASAEANLGWNEELTISEAVRDPLIAIVMRADGVTCEEFTHLLETAARTMKAKRKVVEEHPGQSCNEHGPALPALGWRSSGR